MEAARLLTGSTVLAVLVGDGSQRRALERQASGLRNVRFTGLVAEDLYPVVLAAADVLLVNERPSVGDMALPSKLTSYLVAGRPILAAVADGGASQRELLSTGGAAWTIPPGDPAALATALASLAQDRPRREAMSRCSNSACRAHPRPRRGTPRTRAPAAPLRRGASSPPLAQRPQSAPFECRITRSVFHSNEKSSHMDQFSM